MTVRELQARIAGFAPDEAKVFFDVEARRYDCHLVPVDGAHLLDADESPDGRPRVVLYEKGPHRSASAAPVPGPEPVRLRPPGIVSVAADGVVCVEWGWGSGQGKPGSHALTLMRYPPGPDEGLLLIHTWLDAGRRIRQECWSEGEACAQAARLVPWDDGGDRVPREPPPGLLPPDGLGA